MTQPKQLSRFPVHPDLLRRLLELHANHVFVRQALDAWRYQDLAAANALAVGMIALADANTSLQSQFLDALQRRPIPDHFFLDRPLPARDDRRVIPTTR